MLRRTVTYISVIVTLLLASHVAAAPAGRGGGAFVKSLIIPGWGQYSLGQRNTALVFFGVDVALAGTILTLDAYGRSTRDDYRALAAAHAGVVGNHNHRFYVDVGNWMNVDQYNERRLQERSFGDLYTSPTDRWAWDSDEQRAKMKRIRIRSDRAFNSILYVVGGMVLNRVVAAVHAGRSARASTTTAATTHSFWTVRLLPHENSQGIRLSVTHLF